MVLASVLLILATSPAVRYRVTCDLPDVPDPRWRVDVTVTGLDPKRRDVRWQLPGWGEWYELDDYYIRELRGEPPVRHKHDLLEQFTIELGATWDGTLHVSYSIPIVTIGSRVRTNHRLLPWCAGSYVHGFSTNTLMRVVVGEQFADADRTLELVPPKGWSTMTGWSGLAAGPQTVKLAADADNTVIVFGHPTASVESRDDGGLLEVVQFGSGPDCTRREHDLARELRLAYAATTGSPAASVERLVITDPELGGTHVEGAITMGHPGTSADGRGGSRFEVSTAHFIAHELFHAWLPGVLKQGEPALEWFFEGFTEYWALWQLVAIGEATPDDFVRRLHWFDELARKSPSFGKVTFADPAVNWREPDAETIAYKDGCLLAFHFDALLREAGEPGLPKLFRDFVKEESASLRRASLENWLAAQGLEEAWANCCKQPFAPDPRADLLRVGFRALEKIDPNDRHRVVTSVGGTTEPFFRFAE